jgi:hypothetical protein
VAGIIKETIPAEEIVAPVATTGLGGFVAKFTVLKGAQRELWLTFLIKFFIYTAYSVTNKTMVLWLSKDLGFSDQAAGALPATPSFLAASRRNVFVYVHVSAGMPGMLESTGYR